MRKVQAIEGSRKPDVPRLSPGRLDREAPPGYGGSEYMR